MPDQRNGDAQLMLAFEEGLTKLEKVVNLLERGEVPLENAINLFEEGMQLAKLCSQKIEQAEQRVEVLTKEHTEWTTKPFEVAE